MSVLEAFFDVGVTAVRGDTSVARALTATRCPVPDQIIAVGKAATSMARAATARFGDSPALIVTKYAHADDAPPGADVIEAAHPVPDANSLMAGARIRQTVAGMPANSHLLMLVSGGASALAEDLVDGVSLDDLATRTGDLLAAGADIHEMNRLRKTLSRIKGGRLLDHFCGARVTTMAISDVRGDNLSVIGSGIGDAPENPGFEFSSHIVASNRIARAAICEKASDMGFQSFDHDEPMYDDVNAVALAISAALEEAPRGVHVFGGEPTVILPPNPGKGGRNQSLALLLARQIAGLGDIRLLVAGTDGTDGPTDAAGGIVDGATWEASGTRALERADAGTWLEARSALLRTGPTGTNVMDLVIALTT